MIYAIRAVGTEYIKIGKANSVGRRLRELETASPHELHIEAAADWPDAEERRLHIYLRVDLVRAEWFRHSDRLAKVIDLLRAETGLEDWKAICELELIRGKRDIESRSSALPNLELRRRERADWWRNHADL